METFVFVCRQTAESRCGATLDVDVPIVIVKAAYLLGLL